MLRVRVRSLGPRRDSAKQFRILCYAAPFFFVLRFLQPPPPRPKPDIDLILGPVRHYLDACSLVLHHTAIIPLVVPHRV